MYIFLNILRFQALGNWLKKLSNKNTFCGAFELFLTHLCHKEQRGYWVKFLMNGLIQEMRDEVIIGTTVPSILWPQSSVNDCVFHVFSLP